MLGLRRSAVHFALVAMLLRALLPMGWMPGQAAGGQPVFVICSIDAPAGQHHGDQQPAGQHAHEECPFAAAPHVAPPALAAQLVLPSLSGQFAHPPGGRVAAETALLYHPGSPRAPPLNA